MKVITVLHAQKVEDDMAKTPVEIHANPTLSVKGLVNIHGLVEQIRAKGPYIAIYSSRLARALDTASILALALDMDIETIKGLGQHSNRDASGDYCYPGHESETVVEWKNQAVKALLDLQERHGSNDTILIVSHRPSVGGIVAHTKSIEDKTGIMEIVLAKGFGPILEFEVSGDEITLIR